MLRSLNAVSWRLGLEKSIWEKTNAVVIAQTPRDIDVRWLSCVDGQWLNDGNDGALNLEEADATVARVRAYRKAKTLRNSRPPVADRHIFRAIQLLAPAWIPEFRGAITGTAFLGL